MTAQILRDSMATVVVTFSDQNGEPRPPVSPVSVTVYRADGTEMMTDVPALPGTSPEKATLVLSPADTADLDQLTAVWVEANGARSMTVVDIVGGYYFSLTEARTSGPQQNDPTKYPEELVVAARRAVEEECERITGRAFVPRYRRVVMDGRGQSSLQLPDSDIRWLRSCSYTDLNGSTTYVENQLSFDATGRITLAYGGFFPFGGDNVTVEYEHGLDEPPQRIKSAALLRVREVMRYTKTGAPDPATFQIVEGRVFGIPQPGVKGSLTGNPEIDAAYDEWTFQRGTLGAVRLYG